MATIELQRSGRREKKSDWNSPQRELFPWATWPNVWLRQPGGRGRKSRLFERFFFSQKKKAIAIILAFQTFSTCLSLFLESHQSFCLPSVRRADRLVHRLMVLCPFIFVLTDPVTPPLLLQSSEVAAVHWVPFRRLLSPLLRTHEHVDPSTRLGRNASTITKALLRLVLGKMVFSAIRLVPSESLFAPSILLLSGGDHQDERSSPPASPPSFFFSSIQSLFRIGRVSALGPTALDAPRPLNLWGLTLGMLCDLLDLLLPHNTSTQLWDYPTMTPPDLRLLISLVSSDIKRKSARARQENGCATSAAPAPAPAIDTSTIATPVSAPLATVPPPPPLTPRIVSEAEPAFIIRNLDNSTGTAAAAAAAAAAAGNANANANANNLSLPTTTTTTTTSHQAAMARTRSTTPPPPPSPTPTTTTTTTNSSNPVAASSSSSSSSSSSYYRRMNIAIIVFLIWRILLVTTAGIGGLVVYYYYYYYYYNHYC